MCSKSLQNAAINVTKVAKIKLRVGLVCTATCSGYLNVSIFRFDYQFASNRFISGDPCAHTSSSEKLLITTVLRLSGCLTAQHLGSSGLARHRLLGFFADSCGRHYI